MIILDLINNLALLLALSMLSGFIGKRCRHSVYESVLQGILFGCAAMIDSLLAAAHRLELCGAGQYNFRLDLLSGLHGEETRPISDTADEGLSTGSSWNPAWGISLCSSMPT